MNNILNFTLVDKYNFVHFSTGDLLHEEISKGTENGKLIKQIMSLGKYVPVKITCGLIKKSMDNYSKDKIFLIDGYPRNQDNIDGWIEIFGDDYILIASIIMDCDEKELEKRLIERAKSSGRIDDNLEVIKKRFKTHVEESKPIEEKLKKMGPYIEVNGNNLIDNIFNQISVELDKILIKYK